MLDQYILGKLKESQDEISKINDKLSLLREEEETCEKMIDNLMDKEDVGIEVFSPRNADDTTKMKITKIKHQIEDLRLDEERLRDGLERVAKEEKRYQDMLLEVQKQEEERENEILKQKGEDINIIKDDEKIKSQENEKEELKKILSKIDKCLNLINANKYQCKNELMNLKYYLKALISSKI